MKAHSVQAAASRLPPPLCHPYRLHKLQKAPGSNCKVTSVTDWAQLDPMIFYLSSLFLSWHSLNECNDDNGDNY